MTQKILCTKHCKASNPVKAGNIVELLAKRDKQGYFEAACGHRGYIEKHFELQEEGEAWKPFLRGAITFAGRKKYQPFVYLVSYKPNARITDLWFAYYKDLRSKKGGRLKLGHGPGGPPVLGSYDLLELLRRLVAIGVLSPRDVQKAISKKSRSRRR